MIVVEGFDGSGKTTLAKRLSDMLGWPVLHTGGPTADRTDVARCMLRSVQRAKTRCIQDRITQISEAAYSMLVYPGKAGLALAGISKLPRVTMIYCRPRASILITSLNKHDDKEYDTTEHMKHVNENAAQIIATYDSVMSMVENYMPVVRYDRTRPDDDMIRKIVEQHR